MERVTWVNHIRLCTRDLLNELLDTVEKETAGIQDDTSSRLKQATERIRTKLEVIDEFDKYITACDDVGRFVDKALKPSRRDSRVPLNPDLQPNPQPDKYVGVSWPPAYLAERHTWDGLNPGQFPCEAAPETTGSKPTVWEPCMAGASETYNVMYSDKTDGGMQ